MIHICFLSSFDRIGQPIMYRQAKSLVEVGFDVTMIFSDNKPAEIIDGIRVIGCGYVKPGYAARLFLTPKLLYNKALEVNADIYQTCDIENILPCLCLKKHGKKIVFDLLENHPYSYLEKTHSHLLFARVAILPIMLIMKYGLRKFDVVFTVTDDIKNYLEKWGIQKVQLFTNYPIVNYDRKISFEDYCSRKDQVIYFGLIYNVSRQDIFLDALDKTNGVGYLLAGRFCENKDCDYPKSVMSKNAWKKVSFVEGFKREELDAMLSGSTMSNVLRDFSSMKGCVNGSMGIVKLFESMEAGLPIICSDVATYRSMMEKYPCGILVNPLDANAIADAINYLKTNKEEAYKMGQIGRKAVLEEFNWEIEVNKYINILKSMMA